MNRFAQVMILVSIVYAKRHMSRSKKEERPSLNAFQEIQIKIVKFTQTKWSAQNAKLAMKLLLTRAALESNNPEKEEPSKLEIFWQIDIWTINHLIHSTYH